MHHREAYMHIFQQNRVSGSVKTVHTNLLAQYRTPIVVLKKSIILDMHHHNTYMQINFQQNRLSISVKTVHTNLFAKICNLQLEFRKITPFGHALPPNKHSGQF